jgi:hypothetical protein
MAVNTGSGIMAQKKVLAIGTGEHLLLFSKRRVKTTPQHYFLISSLPEIVS